MSSESVQKAVAPFSIILISVLFCGNVYFGERMVTRIESTLDQYEERLRRTENAIIRLETQLEQEKKRCSKKSLRG